jgi:putative transcriptional regulator
MRLSALLFAASLAFASTTVAQQDEPPNGLFLVAKPDLVDPNFRQSVVLVTQTEDYSTVGVIINRPTDLKVEVFLREGAPATRYRDVVFAGGPVMREVLVALFRSDSTPEAPAFHVLKDLYLSMHPQNLQPLLESDSARYRLYAGFSGWAPRQLESEMMRDGWYILPADVETVFRKDTSGLWQELVQRAEKRPIAWRGEFLLGVPR